MLMQRAFWIICFGATLAAIGVTDYYSRDRFTVLIPLVIGAVYVHLVAAFVFRLFVRSSQDVHVYVGRMLYLRHLLAESEAIDALGSDTERSWQSREAFIKRLNSLLRLALPQLLGMGPEVTGPGARLKVDDGTRKLGVDLDAGTS